MLGVIGVGGDSFNAEGNGPDQGMNVSIRRCIRLDTDLFTLGRQSFQTVGQGQIGRPVREIDLAPGGFNFGLQLFP